ncbi:hypothetical protein [Actinomadura sp. BRA 177]|uniref:hypothetical protein n=1 Tax=Actinomadura sp. BRA 177 TaxID=2745202 RepID=UPI001595F2D1|nr:hypothetical protein [Actinomadura sp. BRA 177]NVI90933.1 hypothetical protein [Actinomadura sp. BRA 177]
MPPPTGTSADGCAANGAKAEFEQAPAPASPDRLRTMIHKRPLTDGTVGMPLPGLFNAPYPGGPPRPAP